MSNQPTHPSGYEKQDTNATTITIVSVISILLIVFLVIFLYDLFVQTTEEVIYEQQLKPESKELQTLLAEEDSILGGYHLIDSTNGTYSIPIDRAIELIIEEAGGTAASR